MSEPTAARAGARPLLDLPALARFLERRGIAEGPLEAHAIGSGHSNPTFLVRARGGTEVVVRRPPPGPLPPSAHDVLREARVLGAVAGRLPVARVLAVCAEPEVLGAPFYVMERVHGHVITDAVPPALTHDRLAVADALVDVLVDLHGLDWRGCGLAGFGRPVGYLERQIGRFSRLWSTYRTRPVPAVDRVAARLASRLPPSGPATLVHGDYRLGNVMFAPRAPARIVAVFDWEMATIGDPLADLGYLAAFWVQPDDPPLRMFELSQATRTGGFPTREQIVDRYAQRSGRDVAELRWYEALALWKLAIAMEGNYRRARAGTVANPYLAGFREGVVELAERAAELAGVATRPS